jgi:large subunit ribosomal protein L21
MFAVLKTGGKQYKVAKNDVIIVEKLTALSGDIVQFDQVLMISDIEMRVGDPLIAGAAVLADVIEQTKNKKVTSFVKRRRKHSSQRTRGHRQNVTVLRVTALMASGAKTSGLQIESGATVIGSNPLIVKNTKAEVTKAETAKKPAAKSEAVKKTEAKAEAAKKPAAKSEAAKKPAAKSEVAKKPEAKSEAAKKPAAKSEAAKKPAAKSEAAKKPAAKAEAAKKPASKKTVVSKPTKS